jgi:CBS domain-containing protein
MQIPAIALRALHVLAIDFAVADPPTCRPDESVAAARARMHARASEFLIVVEARDKVLGLITIRDITRAVVSTGTPPARLLVAQAMSSMLIAVHEDASLAEAASLMQHFQVRRIPVIDPEGLLAGVITLNDLAPAGPRIQRAETIACSSRAALV